MVFKSVLFFAEKRKKQRALETIIAMNEFESVLNGDKGWKNEQEMLDDMAEFRRERLGIPA
ncbi:MAG: hypothetical protein IJ158_14465 [Treponema sp.]|nr:hypothetical protein [Treponema sp.]